MEHSDKEAVKKAANEVEAATEAMPAPQVVDIMELPPMPGEHFPKEVKKSLRQVRDLMKANKVAKGCAQALLDAYQLQQWAAYALIQAGVDEKAAGLLLEYVKLKALVPFQQQVMRDSLRDATLPFVADRILEHVKDRTEEAKKNG